jgi:hypothetical protein
MKEAYMKNFIYDHMQRNVIIDQYGQKSHLPRRHLLKISNIKLKKSSKV